MLTPAIRAISPASACGAGSGRSRARLRRGGSPCTFHRSASRMLGPSSSLATYRTLRKPCDPRSRTAGRQNRPGGQPRNPSREPIRPVCWNPRVATQEQQSAQPRLDPSTDQEQRVTPLELFFDLVFVLSFTQVTAVMAADPTWQGLGEGMLVLAAVWWAWAAYGWLTNAIDADENLNRLAMFASMGAMLIVSLAIPQAFGEEALLFACAYAFVRVMHVVLYVRNTRKAGDEDNLGAILTLTPGFLLTSALFVIGGALGGDAQVVIWLVAVVLDYATPLVFGNEAFHLHPGHFAERHGLIVIIALGESIVAIGAGAGFELEGGEVVAAGLGIAAVAALWWAYFDIVAIV